MTIRFIEPKRDDPRLKVERRYRMVIGGRSVDAASGRTIKRESPVHPGLVVGEWPEASGADVEAAMQLPQVERTLSEAKRKMQQAMHARDQAKQTLDQALLDLQHTAIDLKGRPNDLIQKVGQTVLERAERIRQQVAETPYSPSWLKDLSLAPKAGEAGEAAESLEDSPEELATGAVVETKKAKVTLAGAKKKKAKKTRSAEKSVH